MKHAFAECILHTNTHRSGAHRSPNIIRSFFAFVSKYYYIPWQTGKCGAFGAKMMLNVRCSIMVKL